MKRKQQAGFTIIELVMVIVILGILAAYAVPRMTRVGDDARAAATSGMEATIRSASSLIHSAWMTNQTAQQNNLVTLEDNTTVTTTATGYATADNAGIGAAIGAAGGPPAGFTDPGVANFYTLQRDGANASPTNCQTSYTVSGGIAVIASDTTNCK